MGEGQPEWERMIVWDEMKSGINCEREIGGERKTARQTYRKTHRVRERKGGQLGQEIERRLRQ